MKKIRLNIFGLLTLGCALTPIALGGCSNRLEVGELTVDGEAPEDASSDDDLQDDGGDGDGEPSQGDADTPDVVESMCGDGTKLCDGVCVPTDSIDHCLGCQPCPVFDEGANVEITCTNAGCQYECAADFVDLDGDLQDNNFEGDGCECDSSAVEICDGEDNDCDGEVDEGVNNGCGGCEPFAQGDGPGDECGQPECPGIRECDPEDNNNTVCEGSEDLNACEGCGALSNPESLSVSEPGAGCGDCGVVVCDGESAVRCEDPGFTEYFEDRDEDSFGADEGASEMLCAPGGTDGVFTATERGDCDDRQPDINPNAEELCDGVDNNCTQLVDAQDVDNFDVESACPPPDEVASQSCVGGACVFECNEGAVDLNGDVEDGCECISALEICDGADNDCDGDVDEDEEGEPLTQPCYEGPEGTEGVGLCREGARTCEGGAFGSCEGQVLPAPEICDGLNNDCDGDVDEDEEGEPLTQPCYEGPEGTENVGLCRGGARSCEGGAFGSCEGQVLPAPEICDGLNNDCEGGVDDDLTEVLCDNQQGVCAGASVECQGVLPECSEEVLADRAAGDGEQYESGFEVACADGKDNDCDGSDDEECCVDFTDADARVALPQVDGFDEGESFLNPDVVINNEDGDATVLWVENTLALQQQDLVGTSAKLARMTRQGDLLSQPVELIPNEPLFRGRLVPTSVGFAVLAVHARDRNMRGAFLAHAWTDVSLSGLFESITGVVDYDVVGEGQNPNEAAVWVLSQGTGGISLSRVGDTLDGPLLKVESNLESTFSVPRIAQASDGVRWMGWVERKRVFNETDQLSLHLHTQGGVGPGATLGPCTSIDLSGDAGARRYDLATGTGDTPFLVAYTRPGEGEGQVSVVTQAFDEDCNAQEPVEHVVMSVAAPAEYLELVEVPDRGYLLLVRSADGDNNDSTRIVHLNLDGSANGEVVVLQSGTDVDGASRMALSPERAFGAPQWVGLVFSDRSDDDTPFEGFYRQFNLDLDPLCFE